MTPEAVAGRSRTRVMLDLYRTFGRHLRPYWRWFALGYAAMALSVFTRTLTP